MHNVTFIFGGNTSRAIMVDLPSVICPELSHESYESTDGEEPVDTVHMNFFTQLAG